MDPSQTAHGADEVKYPWYELVTDGSLAQGDLLRSFPLVGLAAPFDFTGQGRVPLRRQRQNVVVLTQSCDLDADKVENVLVCPYFPPGQLADSVQELGNKKGRAKVKAGGVVSMYMLPPCPVPGFAGGCLVVNFRQIAAVPLEYIRQFAAGTGRRVRLLPPYREDLAQAFARFIMRVGFPRDYDSEDSFSDTPEHQQ